MNSPYHIAILDDHEDLLSMTATMLRIESYKVTPCKDLESLMSTIQNDPPHTLLLDMLISKVDGREVCKTIKSQATTAHLPVIIFSAHPYAEESCIDAGADFFLPKPFTKESLYEVVKKALELNLKAT